MLFPLLRRFAKTLNHKTHACTKCLLRPLMMPKALSVTVSISCRANCCDKHRNNKKRDGRLEGALRAAGRRPPGVPRVGVRTDLPELRAVPLLGAPGYARGWRVM